MIKNLVVSGLVDAHTHPVWAGDRVHEFAMKVNMFSPFFFDRTSTNTATSWMKCLLLLQLAGATYMDVHRAGGGIHFTVEHTRAASCSELLASLSSRLVRMQRAGTTLVECKSGYGLELQTELKMLEVIEEARRTLPINISSTYCGAHAVPKYGPSPPQNDLKSHHMKINLFICYSEGRRLQKPQTTSCRFSCRG